MLASYAPLNSVETSPGPYSVEQMTQDVFEKDMLLADCEQMKGDKYMACCLIYRGNVSTMDANRAVDLAQRRKTFNMVDWCPTGFKIGINRSEPGYIENGDLARTDRSLTLISNSTAV